MIAVANIAAIINYLIQSWFFYADTAAINRLSDSVRKQSSLLYLITVLNELSHSMIIRSEMSF